MGYTKDNPPCSQPGPASTFATVVDSKKNTTEQWRQGGAKSPAEAISSNPNKQPVNPNDVK
jgi:hypothetical protein